MEEEEEEEEGEVERRQIQQGNRFCRVVEINAGLPRAFGTMCL